MCAAGDIFVDSLSDVHDYTALLGATGAMVPRKQTVTRNRKKRDFRSRLLQVLESSHDSCPPETWSDVDSPLQTEHRRTSTPVRAPVASHEDSLLTLSRDHERTHSDQHDAASCNVTTVTPQNPSYIKADVLRRAAGLSASRDDVHVTRKLRRDDRVAPFTRRSSIERHDASMGNSSDKPSVESVAPLKTLTADVTWFQEEPGELYPDEDDSGAFSDVGSPEVKRAQHLPIQHCDSDVTAVDDADVSCEHVLKRRLQARRRQLHLLVEHWFENMTLKCETMTSQALLDL